MGSRYDTQNKYKNILKVKFQTQDKKISTELVMGILQLSVLIPLTDCMSGQWCTVRDGEKQDSESNPPN